jgi:hypothetical protein
MKAQRDLASSSLICALLVLTSLLASVSAKVPARGYYFVRRDYRKCRYPLCGGFWVRQLDGSKFRCSKGKNPSSECYVASIDWTALGLSEAESTNLEQQLVKGQQALVRGKLSRTKYSLPDRKKKIHKFDKKLDKLVAKEAFVAASDQEPKGDFYAVQSNGINCITTPCFSMDEYALNDKQVTSISNVNLRRVDATDQQLEEAFTAIAARGLVVAGRNKNIADDGPAGEGITLKASQFYLRVEAK